jgi:[ribosomal protein S5]-alanine N-acetyltransferase
LAVPPLRTPRLLLRQIATDDAGSLHQALSDAYLMKWWSSAPHKTLGESEDYVARNAEESEGWRCWAITEDGGPAIGWVILIEKRPGVQEIGYILRRDFWGKGFAREAVSAVIRFGFSVLGLRRIFADTDPDNVGSIALLRALGFRKEGHLRAEWETHIGIRDSLIFGLLAEEWQGLT